MPSKKTDAPTVERFELALRKAPRTPPQASRKKPKGRAKRKRATQVMTL